jgi:endonuclease/exonuclease/phosphatase family metal-dependent hydrolase
MDIIVHRTLKVMPFNANGISRQRYELSKQLQDLHVDVALFSETHLKPHERFKSLLAGDLNAKHPFWNSAVSNPSGEKFMALFDFSKFEISAPQCPTHYSPAGNDDVLDIGVHQNIKVSDVIVSDILDSDHLPILFHILDHVKIRNISEPI